MMISNRLNARSYVSQSSEAYRSSRETAAASRTQALYGGDDSFEASETEATSETSSGEEQSGLQQLLSKLMSLIEKLQSMLQSDEQQASDSGSSGSTGSSSGSSGSTGSTGTSDTSGSSGSGSSGSGSSSGTSGSSSSGSSGTSTSGAAEVGTGSEAVNNIADIAAGWNYEFKLSSVGPEDGWGLGGDGAGNCVDMAEEAQSMFEQAGVESRIVSGTCDSSNTESGRIGHVWLEYKDPESGEWKMFDPTGAALQQDSSGAFTNPLNNVAG